MNNFADEHQTKGKTIDDEDRDDVGWILFIPLTMVVEPSTEITLSNNNDDCKEETMTDLYTKNWFAKSTNQKSTRGKLITLRQRTKLYSLYFVPSSERWLNKGWHDLTLKSSSTVKPLPKCNSDVFLR